jgi:hypothetical protein
MGLISRAGLRGESELLNQILLMWLATAETNSPQWVFWSEIPVPSVVFDP